MLTNEDLGRIRKVVREEFEVEVRTIRDDLESQIILSKMDLANRFSKLDDRVKNIEIQAGRVEKALLSARDDLVVIKKDLKTLKADMSRARRDISVAIKMFNEDYVGLQKRIDAIEEHVGLPSS